MKYLFKNALVVTMNQKSEVLKDCDVLIENDHIKAIGNISDEDKEKAHVIEASGKLLMPGLVNAHSHAPMTLLRNYADDMDLQTWLFEHIFPTEDKFTGHDIHIGTMLGIMEMLASGTTSFIDMYFYMDDMARAVEESGIRAQLSRGVTNPQTGSDFSEDKKLLESIEFYKKWNGAADGRITGAFAPHAIYTCSPEYIRAVRDAAEKLSAPIHVHVDETRVEHEDCLKQHGKTPTKHLYDLGLLDLKTVAAHCTWVTEEDMALLKEKQVTIAHNPASNLKLASGVAPVPEALKLGINVALGTDGASSNNNLNLFEEINLAAFIHKGTRHDPLLISAAEALTMATANGAKALGMHNLGMVSEGNKADLILVDLEKPHFKPLHNPISALAYSAQGADVCLTMVDGRILYQDGEYKTIDKEKVWYELDKIVKRIF
ncbi:MAG: amidohydrolase [Clostridia bacterium]|nr:amidohydrolase [Clostridia bacterium]